MIHKGSDFSVVRLLLPTGERLPCLVESSTWFPVRVATRWAVRYRRNRVQSSTLAGNLRTIGKVYSWARSVAKMDLDDFLCSGQRLNVRQIESLAAYLRDPANEISLLGKRPCKATTSALPGATDYLDAGSFDNALSVVQNFLKWSLDTMNCGRHSSISFEQLMTERFRIELLFDELRIGAAPSDRMQPLDDEEISAIRTAIGPQHINGSWVFPRVFSSRTRFRNWLMFETALALGIRRGELLKLKTSSIPRGHDTGIRVLRCPDDPEDTRTHEPAVKTAERVIPASRALLNSINIYLTNTPPLGRVLGASTYLFVSIQGNPVSLDRADDIIQDIAGHSSVDVSWHRLRHTWAEKIANVLCEKPDGADQLQWLGGWTNPESSKRYIQNAIAAKAQETLQRISALSEQTAIRSDSVAAYN